MFQILYLPLFNVSIATVRVQET